MRKALTAILFFVYLIGSTEAYQLLKLPALFVHFVKHCQEDPNTSMLSFLKLHYQEATVFDADWQQDMQLPFKTHEDDQGLMALCYYPPITMSSVKAPVSAISIVSATPHHAFVLSCYAADIFQPPKA